eukprot:4604494-Prymnesium_polylepis.1
MAKFLHGALPRTPLGLRPRPLFTKKHIHLLHLFGAGPLNLSGRRSCEARAVASLKAEERERAVA